VPPAHTKIVSSMDMYTEHACCLICTHTAVLFMHKCLFIVITMHVINTGILFHLKETRAVNQQTLKGFHGLNFDATD